MGMFTGKSKAWFGKSRDHKDFYERGRSHAHFHSRDSDTGSQLIQYVVLLNDCEKKGEPVYM